MQFHAILILIAATCEILIERVKAKVDYVIYRRVDGTGLLQFQLDSPVYSGATHSSKIDCARMCADLGTDCLAMEFDEQSGLCATGSRIVTTNTTWRPDRAKGTLLYSRGIIGVRSAIAMSTAMPTQHTTGIATTTTTAATTSTPATTKTTAISTPTAAADTTTTTATTTTITTTTDVVTTSTTTAATEAPTATVNDTALCESNPGFSYNVLGDDRVCLYVSDADAIAKRDEAANVCADLGGMLYTMKTVERYDIFLLKRGEKSSKVWVGLTKEISTDKFFWEDGEELVRNGPMWNHLWNLRAGQPDMEDEQLCVFSQAIMLKLNDVGCGLACRYACEIVMP